MPPSTLSPYKIQFIQICINEGILKFGSYLLKSGRLSPYFFNAGEFYSAQLLHAISTAFAQTIIEKNSSNSPLDFDVVYGPAYKGIPLATSTIMTLRELSPEKYQNVCYSFDRKEIKDHGEGGSIVGAPLKNNKVLIVDDVVTSGSAKREAIDKIQKQGGTVTGILVALDRMERISTSTENDNVSMLSAIGEIKKEFGIPVLSILTLDDLIEGLESIGRHQEVLEMQNYKTKYEAVN